jgi:hypothetical protein
MQACQGHTGLQAIAFFHLFLGCRKHLLNKITRHLGFPEFAKPNRTAFTADIIFVLLQNHTVKERGWNNFLNETHRFGSNLFDLNLRKLME